jgi:hypothetical protein
MEKSSSQTASAAASLLVMHICAGAEQLFGAASGAPWAHVKHNSEKVDKIRRLAYSDKTTTTASLEYSLCGRRLIVAPQSLVADRQ